MVAKKCYWVFTTQPSTQATLHAWVVLMKSKTFAIIKMKYLLSHFMKLRQPWSQRQRNPGFAESGFSQEPCTVCQLHLLSFSFFPTFSMNLLMVNPNFPAHLYKLYCLLLPQKMNHVIKWHFQTHLQLVLPVPLGRLWSAQWQRQDCS